MNPFRRAIEETPGLTPSKAAKAIKVHEQTIYKWMSDDEENQRFPRKKHLKAFAELTNKPLYYFLAEEGRSARIAGGGMLTVRIDGQVVFQAPTTRTAEVEVDVEKE